MLTIILKKDLKKQTRTSENPLNAECWPNLKNKRCEQKTNAKKSLDTLDAELLRGAGGGSMRGDERGGAAAWGVAVGAAWCRAAGGAAPRGMAGTIIR